MKRIEFQAQKIFEVMFGVIFLIPRPLVHTDVPNAPSEPLVTSIFLAFFFTNAFSTVSAWKSSLLRSALLGACDNSERPRAAWRRRVLSTRARAYPPVPSARLLHPSGSLPPL